jgi:hypothetical protein
MVDWIKFIKSKYILFSIDLKDGEGSEGESDEGNEMDE